MNERQESYKIFAQIMTGYFDRVKKNLPKKYSSFKELVSKMGDLLKTENSSQLSIGKYFAIFKLTFNMRS